MKKVAIMAITGILFFSVFTVFLPVKTCKAASGNTLYVGGSGPGNYSNIQDAINSSNDGDMVYVHIGTYYENLVINKKISLIGENKVTTIIDGSGGENGITILVNWVNFSGFTVQNCEMYGIDGIEGVYMNIPSYTIINNVSSNYINVSGNIIINNDWDGIFFGSSNNNTISSNIIENNNKSGITIWDDNNTIFGNTITGNKEFGIWLLNSKNNIVFKNAINKNRIDGIYLDGSSCNNISENIITDNTNGIWIGDSSQNNNISGNTITSEHEGIRLDKCSNTKILDNNITNCIYYGIYVSADSTNPYISEDNIFANNGENIFYYPLGPSKSQTPGFELILVVCAIALVLLLKRKRIN